MTSTGWVDVVEVWAAIGWFHPWLVGHEEAWQQALVDAVEGTSPAQALDALLASLGDPATHVAVPLTPTSSAGVTRVEDLPTSDDVDVVDARGATSLTPLWTWLFPDGVAPRAPLRNISRLGWTPWPADYSYEAGHFVCPASGSVSPGRPLALILDGVPTAAGLAALGALRLARRVVLVGSDHATGTQPVHDLDTRVPMTIRAVEALNDVGRPFMLLDACATGDAAVAEARTLLEAWPPKAPTELGWDAPEVRPYTGPSFAERLAAVASVFRVMKYAYGYPHLLTQPWPEVLAEAVREAEKTDAEAGDRSLLVLVKSLGDRHCNLSVPRERHPGWMQGPFSVMDVQGEVIVTAVLPEAVGVQVGDRVLSVNGDPIGERRAAAARRRANSTASGAALDSATSALRVSGEEITLQLERSDGQARTVVLPTVEWAETPPSTLPTWTVLADGTGYIDLTRLMPDDVDAAMESVMDGVRLVLDMRGYPNGTAWTLAPRLARRSRKPPEFRIRMWQPGELVTLTEYIVQPTAPVYQGRIAILIDARALSQSEHSCLMYEAAADVLFVGSITSGANGETRMMQLRDSSRVSITPMDVRHGDGRQLQGVGIQPHLAVADTIAGIREGRDEVLEAAVAALKEADR